MPGRPPHNRKKDAGEKDDGNRTRVGRKGVIMHCKLCKGEGHNIRGCPTRKEDESVGKAVRGGKNGSARGSVRGVKVVPQVVRVLGGVSRLEVVVREVWV